MDEKILEYKLTGLELCNRIHLELKRNQEDADLFFSGDLYKSYVTATETAINKLQHIQIKIRNL